MKPETLKTLEKLVTSGAPREEIEAFVSDNLTTKELVTEFITAFTEVVKHECPAQIRITEEEFRNHFRIIGLRNDGTPENRGTYVRKK